MKRCAFQTIRPGVSRKKNAVFPLTFGRAALCRRLVFHFFQRRNALAVGEDFRLKGLLLVCSAGQTGGAPSRSRPFVRRFPVMRDVGASCPFGRITLSGAGMPAQKSFFPKKKFIKGGSGWRLRPGQALLLLQRQKTGRKERQAGRLRPMRFDRAGPHVCTVVWQTGRKSTILLG